MLLISDEKCPLGKKHHLANIFYCNLYFDYEILTNIGGNNCKPQTGERLRFSPKRITNSIDNSRR